MKQTFFPAIISFLILLAPASNMQGLCSTETRDRSGIYVNLEKLEEVKKKAFELGKNIEAINAEEYRAKISEALHSLLGKEEAIEEVKRATLRQFAIEGSHRVDLSSHVIQTVERFSGEIEEKDPAVFKEKLYKAAGSLHVEQTLLSMIVDRITETFKDLSPDPKQIEAEIDRIRTSVISLYGTSIDLHKLAKDAVTINASFLKPEDKAKPSAFISKDQVLLRKNYILEDIFTTLGTIVIPDFAFELKKKLSREATDEEIAAAKKEYYETNYFKELEKTVLDNYSRRFGLFDHNRWNVLIASIILLAIVAYYIYHAKKGTSLFIRRIAGLQAIDEAVGRATEMGKPVLFIPGIYDMDDIQTVAGISILGHVAKKTAEYETPLLVPCTRSLVMSTAQEVVKEAYLKAGRPDAFKAENIHYITDDQFGYVSGVDGIMMRQRPAANFYLGVFYAESLILAETGHSIGSIQIAGTAQPSQLPFFIAACDYTLIGEELFAAGAYLSREPMALGSLKGQDAGKVIIISIILIGVLLRIFGTGPFQTFYELFNIK